MTQVSRQGGARLRGVGGVPQSLVAVNEGISGLVGVGPGAEQAARSSVAGLPLHALHLLVVDDDAPVRNACCEIGRQMGFAVFSAEDLEAAKTILRHQRIDVMLLDLKLPGGSGLGLLEEVKALHPETGVVVMTAFATVSSAVEAMRIGAADYLTKPFSFDELTTILEVAGQRVTLDVESRRLRERLRTQKGVGQLVGNSPEMEKLYRIISKVANASHPLLIVGEEGTGKERVARSIHFNGLNASRPFIPVDCGSLAPATMERELFGYAKGAFAGATRAKDGLLASADGGTLYLDEVGDLPVEMQGKLMRALQEKAVYPVGSTGSVPIAVRVLAATSRDLSLLVEQGRFRKDLYFRLNIVNLRIPPLRDRRQDIPELAQACLERMERERGMKLTFSDEALRLMSDYDWPGNLRELEYAIERACRLASGPVVHMADLPTQLQDFRMHTQQARVGKVRTLAAGSGVEEAGGVEVLAPLGGIVSIAEMEKAAILRTIDQLKGDKLLAAKLLGIGKTTLYRKLKEYGIGDGLPMGEE